MHHQMINEQPAVKFVVKVNGVPISSPLPSQLLREQFVASLPTRQQQLAEIVPVTPDNKQILFG